MIQFAEQDIHFVLRDKMKTKDWLKTILKDEGKKVGEISIIFCSDDYLAKMNEQYLKHTTLTDIITFDYSEKNVISGDIFISVERVKENAWKFSKTLNNELSRVMAHGVLHLIGYKDKSDVEKTEMRSMEDKYLLLNPLL